MVVAAAFVHFYGVPHLQVSHCGLEGGCTDDSHICASFLKLEGKLPKCLNSNFLPEVRGSI